MRILCATDFLQKSEAAIDRAASLADRLRADLTLLHVVVPGESERALEQSLHTALMHAKSRVQPPLWTARQAPNIAVRAGNAARIVLDTAAQSKARLLVLGPHRKRPLRDALEGTIAEKALASKQCPVLIVKDEWQGPYRRVLMALDMSQASATAIRAAEAMVIGPDTDALIVHAQEPPYQGMLHYAGVGLDSLVRYADGWRREAKTAMRDLLKLESADFSRYDIQIEEQPAALGILRAIERHKPDLLVMGTHGGGRLRKALVGSVANRVLNETNGDVLIVPQGSFGVSRKLSNAFLNGAQPRKTTRGEGHVAERADG